ncbi:hypothetical protein [Longispora urticae]
MVRPRFDLVLNGYDTQDVDLVVAEHETLGWGPGGWASTWSREKLRTADVGYDIAQVNEYLMSLVKPPTRSYGPAIDALWPPAPPPVGKRVPTVTKVRQWAARGALVLVGAAFLLSFALVCRSDRLGIGNASSATGTAAIGQCRSTGWSLEAPFLCDAAVEWEKGDGDDAPWVRSQESLSGLVPVEERCFTVGGGRNGLGHLKCVITTADYPTAEGLQNRLFLVLCSVCVLGAFPVWWAASTLQDRRRQLRIAREFRAARRESDRGFI